jgi:Zn-dependent protease with chaperone function
LASKKRQWQGEGTFFDGQTSRAQPVRISINELGISVAIDTSERFFRPFDFRVAERVGNRYVRIELMTFGGAGITIDSPEAVAALQANRFLKSGFLSFLPNKTRLLALVGGLILVVALFFFFGLDLLIDYGLTLVPKSVEEKLGKSAFDSLVQESDLASDGSTLQILEKCAAVASAFDTTTNYTIKISIVEDRKTINAFALPGGYICIYRGIIEIMDDESELFGLLAHEAGHVYLQHGLRRIARSAVIGFVFTALLGDASGLSAVLLDNSSLLLQLNYDRKEEIAADDFALQALQKSNLNQNGLITLFEKMAKEEKDTQPLPFLATHPAATKRIQFLKQKVQPTTANKTILSPQEWAKLKGSGV